MTQIILILMSIHITNGCPWPKATVKSPWVPVTFGHCFLFFLIFYSLFFTALDALPYPALPLPCPCPCPALFRIFLLLPGTRGGSYTGNGQCFFSFCCQGQEEEVTHCPHRRTPDRQTCSFNIYPYYYPKS
jgi:hypothetical protein